jgi:hypothetical protein
MTRATLAQFWPGGPRPRPIHHCSIAIFEKRMDGVGFKAREALLPAKARRVDRGVPRAIPELFGPMPVMARIWRSYPDRPDLAQIPDVSGWRNAMVECVPRPPSDAEPRRPCTGRQGLSRGAAQITREVGALLIFDEVLTFRLLNRGVLAAATG